MVDVEKIRVVCFNLAENLMWEKDALKSEDVEESMKELSEMTEKFLRIALDSYYQVEQLENGQDILVRAINYIDHAHAIPPLRGNYSWFFDTLQTLLELCNPNSGLTKEHSTFLDDLEAGISDYKRSINYGGAELEPQEVQSDSVFDLLAEIRKRPAMYLGKPSIHHLNCYLDGWLSGNQDGIRQANLFAEFITWVERKYKVKSNQGWAKIIDFWSTDEIHALESFFTLLDKFQATK